MTEILIPNPHKAHVADVLSRAEASEAIVDDWFSPVREAWAAGAWVGGKAADFEADMTGTARAAERAAEQITDEIRRLWANCPATVPIGAPI